MSMQELPDNELDRLFRKSAEEFEPEFNPQAWEAMRKKLDDEDGRVAGFAWWKAGVVAVLLAVMGLGGYYLWPEKKLNTITKNQVIEEKVLKAPSTSLPEKNEPTAPKSLSINEKSVPITDKNEVLKGEQTKVLPIAVDNKALTSEETKGVKRNNTSNTASVKDNQAEAAKFTQRPFTSLPTEQQQTTKRNLRVKKTPASQPSVEINDLINPNPIIASKIARVPKNKRSKVAIEDSKRINERLSQSNLPQRNSKKWSTVSSQQPISEKKEEVFIQPASSSTPSVLSVENTRPTLLNLNELAKKNWKLLGPHWTVPVVAYTPPPPPPVVRKTDEILPLFRKGLSARIMASPDLSFIASSEMLKNPALALSVMLEYRFSKRLSIQTGAVRSAKLYTATGEQYVWPESWSSQKARPTEIGANCKVLDIPLNIRFDLSQGQKSRLFVASGISSYVMLNEKYDYTYPPHTYNIKWKTWEGSTGNYWFGVMNMSLGFERQLGRNLSIQAEPYFKLPLAQVGLGKIKLNTSGLFISARYKLGRF
jgi:hypothetical protein